MRKATKQEYVLEKIIADIESGRYGESGKMPTEAEYTERFRVSRQTIRSALARLEQEGRIKRVQGSGTYANNSRISKPRTGTIAVICTYISEYIFPSILRGVGGVTLENDYQILMNSTDNSIASERAILTRLIEHPVDGIIVEGTKTALPNPNGVFYKQLSDMGIPLVFINGYYPDLELDNCINVVTDDYGGSYEATRAMILQGHTNVCGIFKSDDMQGINRYKGYIDALVHHGANVKDSNVIWFSTETKGLLIKNFADFFEEVDPNCSALVCYNDQIAVTALSYFSQAESNIRAMASFDRCFPLGAVEGGISFVSYPHPREELGVLAARKLFRMIEGQRESSVVLPWGKCD